MTDALTAEGEARLRDLGSAYGRVIIVNDDLRRLLATLDAARAELSEVRALLVLQADRHRAEVEATRAERDEAREQQLAERAIAQEWEGRCEDARAAHARETERADAATRERDEARALADRRWQDRRDALSVTSTDGLLSSEWVLRAGQAERERDDARRDAAANAEAFNDQSQELAALRALADGVRRYHASYHIGAIPVVPLLAAVDAAQGPRT